jgi:hypothetical protein
VYRARHASLGTLHAMKVLSTLTPAVRDRLLAEGRIQAALQHENVVSVQDVLVVAGTSGLVMEYIAGPPLDLFIKAGKLSLDQADHLARGIIEGVRAAHELDLIHRDLKPGNILLAIKGGRIVPKITDFGLAKALMVDEQDGRSHTKTGTALGTPAYMAPEQIRDAKNVDKRADIFALGAVLYELVTGERCFAGDDIFQIFNDVITGSFTPPRELVADLPKRMEDAILGALRPDRDERIPSCDQLLAIWRGDEVLSALRTDSWSADDIERAMSLGAGGDLSARGILGRAHASNASLETPMADSAVATLAPAKGSGAIPWARYTMGGAAGALLLVAGIYAGSQYGAAPPLPPRAVSLEPPPPKRSPAPEPDPTLQAPTVETPTAEPTEEPKPVPAPFPTQPRPKPKPTPEVAIAAPVADESEPVAALVMPKTAKVVVTGVDNVVLRNREGDTFRVGEVPPGTYSLVVFFETAEGTPMADIEVAAGDVVTYACSDQVRKCKRK